VQLLKKTTELFALYKNRGSSNSTDTFLTNQAFQNLVDACFYKQTVYEGRLKPAFRAGEVRDSLMAIYVNRIYTHYGGHKKIAYWCHNVHIRKNNAASELYDPLAKPTGVWLNEMFGDRYKAFGLATFSGQVMGYSMGGKPAVYDLTVPDSTCYEYYLDKFSAAPVTWFSLRQYNQLVSNRYLENMMWRVTGFNVPDKQFLFYDMRNSFDGIIFIRTSQPVASFYYK